MICMYIYYDWVIVYVYLLLQYKDYTLEIVQKLLEPPNGFDATTTNVVFWLCIVLHTVCLYHLGSLCCVHTIIIFCHGKKMNILDTHTNIMIIDGQTCRPAR